MTETLKTLLDRAADADFVTPDLDAITREGDRTVRRRRAGLAAAAAAVVVGIGGGVTLAVGDDGGSGRDDSRVADGSAPVDAVTWAQDGAIHAADGATYEVGHPVAAYVRTSAGYAFTDGEGSVYSYVDGEVTPIGSISTDRPELSSDPESSLAVWIDPSGDEPSFVVHDLADGSETRFGETPPLDPADEFPPFQIYAVDGREVYVEDARGALAVDVDSGEARVLEAHPDVGYHIKGVEDGVIAFAAPGAVSSESEAGTVVGSSPTQGVELFPGGGGLAYFSPDGSWVSLEGDKPEVYDATTGEPVAIDIGDRPFGMGYDWVDDDTLAVVAADAPRGPWHILTCEVPAGSCSVAVEDLGTSAEIEGRIAIPNGETTSD